MKTKIETPPDVRLLNRTVADFDRATEFRFQRVTDYSRLAVLCMAHSWFDWAAVFEAHIPKEGKP